MNKNTKGLLVALFVITAAVSVWHLTNKNKKAYAKTIVQYGGSTNYAMLLTFQDGYLKEWAKAIAKAKTEFSFEGKRFNTKGGKQIN